jgi:sarcosine oxidase subunit gamma
MPDARSALDGASEAGFVKVEEMGLQGMITLRGDLAAEELQAAATAATGVDMPDRTGIRTARDGGNALAWMAPDELLVMVPYAEAEERLAQIQAALEGRHVLAVNVSDARALFRLSGGPQVREVVAKLCPVDMAPAAFGPGMFRRTRLAQVPAAFHMPDADSMVIVCFRSVAHYVYKLLCDAAATDSEVRYHV